MIHTLAQAAATPSAPIVPDFLWRDAPIVAILALVLFYQGRKMDQLTVGIGALAGEIKALVELTKIGIGGGKK